jgi:hypothetical protein
MFVSHGVLICQALGVGRLTTGGGRLAGVDVADDHDVDVKLLLTADVVRLCSFDAPVGGCRPWRALEDGRTPS